MADNVLARATVAVSANVKDFDAAMDLLPKKSQQAIKKAMDAIKAEMAKVNQALGQVGNSAADTKKLTDYQKQLGKNLDGVKKSAIGQAAGMGVASKAMGDLGKGFGGASNKLQIFAQGLDDLQYVPEQGLRPILNNLIQLAPALGIAGLVLQQFITHWDDLARVLGDSPVKTAAEEMEELRKKTELTANEAERLARADAMKGKVGELRGAKTAGQQAEESATTTAIVNAGFKDVVAGLRQVAPDLIDQQGTALGAKKALDENLAYVAEQKARASNPNLEDSARGRAASGLAAAGAKTLELRKALEDARNATAEDKVAQAAIIKELGGRRQEFADMVRKNPAAFGGGDKEKGLALANALDLADPVKATMNRIGNVLKDGISNALQVVLPNKAAEANQALTAGQKAAGVEASQSLNGRLAPGLLAQLARDQTIDREALKTSIEAGMKDAGFKNPEQYSAEAAQAAIANTQDAVRRRQQQTGGTPQQAAAALFGENLDQLRAQAQRNRPSVGVTDIEGFQREAQDALLKGSQNDALIEEQKRLAEAVNANTKIQEDLNKTMRERRPGLALQ